MVFKLLWAVEVCAVNVSGLQTIVQPARGDLPPAPWYKPLLFFLLKCHFCCASPNFTEINQAGLAQLLPCATLLCQLQPY